MPTKEIFYSHTVASLKKEISKTNIKGYSKLKKVPLVNLMLLNKDRFSQMKMADSQVNIPKKVKFFIKKNKPILPKVSEKSDKVVPKVPEKSTKAVSKPKEVPKVPEKSTKAVSKPKVVPKVPEKSAKAVSKPKVVPKVPEKSAKERESLDRLFKRFYR